MPGPKNRAWRKEEVKSSGGVSWRLVTGTGAARVRLHLGRSFRDAFGTDRVVDALVAERCRAAMEIEEKATEGTPLYGRVLRLAENREVSVLEDADGSSVQITTGGIDAAIRFLLGDPVIASLLADAPPDYGQMTLREYQEAVWWPIRSGVRKDPAIRTVSEHTVRTEAGYWRQILDAIGHHRLRDLQDDPWIWERYMGGMVQPGRTKVLHRSAYKALLDHAHRRRHIERVHSFWTVVGSTQRVKALEEPLTLEEVARLLSVSSPMRRAMWSVAVGQGLRPSELVRCRWEDLNVTDGVMSVRGDPARGGKGKTEMSASRIPLTPLTARELGRYQEHLNSTGQAPLGEMWTFNGKPIISYKKSLARHAAAAGITKHVTPYLLRHSFASIAWELGIEKDAARCILRHTSERMLDEVYARPRPSAIRERLLAFDLPVAAPEEVVDGDDDGEDVGEERVFTE